VSEFHAAPDATLARLANGGTGSPPAHWVEVVRRHAPQLLHPLSEQRAPASGVHPSLTENEDPVAPSEADGPSGFAQTASPPDIARKPTLADRHETLSAPGRRVHQTLVPPVPGTPSPSVEERSATVERAQPDDGPARYCQYGGAERPSVRLSKPAPRPETPRQPTGRFAPLSRQDSIGSEERGEAQQAPTVSSAHEIPRRPAQTGSKVREPVSQRREPIDAVPEQRMDAAAPAADAISDAHDVKQTLTPMREVNQVAAQKSLWAGSSGTTAAGKLPSTLPSFAPQPIARHTLHATGDAQRRYLQVEPEWPRLPDEWKADPESRHSDEGRWPSLPDYARNAGTRMSPGDALLAASDDRRSRLRQQRRDLEQRGESWRA
jgi:hypothetical protein